MKIAKFLMTLFSIVLISGAFSMFADVNIIYPILGISAISLIPISTSGSLLSTVSGVFDETLLQNAVVKAAQIMFDDRIKQQFVPRAEIIKAIEQIQTANMSIVETKKKEIVMEVEWMNACGLQVRDISDCNFCNTELSTNIQTYTLTKGKEVCFEVSEAIFYKNRFEYEEAVAKGLLKAKKELLEWASQYYVSVLNANKGVNTLGTDGKGTVVGSDTLISPAFWNENLLPYLIRVGIDNQFTDPYLLSGKNLFEQAFAAGYKKLDANGKSIATMYDDMNLWFDLRNIDVVNDPLHVTYLLSRGSVAIANKAIFDTSVREFKDYSAFAVNGADLGFPQFDFDVIYENECSTYNLPIHRFKVILRTDLFVNPTGCDGENTGILTFLCQ